MACNLSCKIESVSSLACLHPPSTTVVFPMLCRLYQLLSMNHCFCISESYVLLYPGIFVYFCISESHGHQIYFTDVIINFKIFKICFSCTKLSNLIYVYIFFKVLTMKDSRFQNLTVNFGHVGAKIFRLHFPDMFCPIAFTPLPHLYCKFKKKKAECYFLFELNCSKPKHYQYVKKCCML